MEQEEMVMVVGIMPVPNVDINKEVIKTKNKFFKKRRYYQISL